MRNIAPLNSHTSSDGTAGGYLMISPFRLAAAGLIALGTTCTSAVAIAQQGPIKIGIPTSIQLQVGRDTQNAAKMAVEEINAQGGLLGRKLEIVVADETENPEQGIAAIKKLTADDKVDVLIGGYTSGVTLAQLPHISNAKTIYLGIGAASPSITAKVKADYDNYKTFSAFARSTPRIRPAPWSISSMAS
jgi:branched-chain amino acid transport system substrate-binding protein